MASKILVIEDDRALRNAVVSALQSGGYEVEFAADGSAGVQALSAKTFDVVLLDIGLPFVDSWHVLSTLEGRRVPSVIVISARGDQADKFARSTWERTTIWPSHSARGTARPNPRRASATADA